MVIGENDTVWDYIQSSNFPISTNYPTVDGSYYMVLAGYTLPQEERLFGRTYTRNEIKFVISIDGGKNFYTVDKIRYNQSRNIFEWDMYNVISNISERNPDATITQIEMTHVSRGSGEHFRGLGAFMPHFVIQILLPKTNILRHYYVYPVEEHDYVRYEASAKFDALYTPMATLKSEEVRLVGRSGTSNWIIFSGRSTNNTPMIVYSNDFGETWKYVDLSATTMYTDPSLTQQSATSPLQEDYFVYLGYVVPWCLNLWYNYGSYSRRSLSYDMDCFFKQHQHGMPLIVDMISYIMNQKKYNTSIIAKKLCTAPFDMSLRVSSRGVPIEYYNNILIKGSFDVGSMVDLILKKDISAEIDTGIQSILRNHTGRPLNILIKSIKYKTYKADLLAEKSDTSLYNMGITIEKDIVDDILMNTERYSPQFPAIGLGYKKRGYPIFDSRKETKE